jgi:DNA phosphorothioation-dependent restriction protein DptF
MTYARLSRQAAKEDTIQTLVDQFSAFEARNQSLVVGINIGMLGNYAAGDNPTPADIKSAISTYLESSKQDDLQCFSADFRPYPKFRITAQHVDAQFIGQLLERLVTSEPNNPFFVASQRTNPESRLANNVCLLQMAEVRERILDVLLHAHLRYDQFLHSLEQRHRALFSPDQFNVTS